MAFYHGAEISGRYTNLQGTNPLLEVLMTTLRNGETKKRDFVRTSDEVAQFLIQEGLKDLTTSHARVVTQTGTVYVGAEVGDKSHLVVDIPRAGKALSGQFMKIFPEAHGGHVSIRRDEETAKPVLGEVKLPTDCSDFDNIFVVDPMLATGGSMAAALECLLDRDASPEKITTLSVVAHSTGVLAIHNIDPSIHVITAAIDPELNDKFFIVPGLGDYGDRYFGSSTSVPATSGILAVQ